MEFRSFQSSSSSNPANHARHSLVGGPPFTLDSALHMKRYSWAAKEFVRPGHVVVDLGCGTGYGIPVIYPDGGRLIAVDFDPNVKSLATAFREPNVDFYCEDVCLAGLAQRIAVTDADVVTSMETIEHLEDYFAFLKNAVELMKPSGTLLIGTPNRSLTYDKYPDRRHMDSSHVQEFTVISLSTILGLYFEQVEIWLEYIPGYWHSPPLVRGDRPKVRRFLKEWLPPAVHRGVARGLRRSSHEALYELEDVSVTRQEVAPELSREAFGLLAIARVPKPL